MVGEEVPERVKEADKARWKEYEKLRKMEKKLQEKILGGPKQRPTSQEQGMQAAISKSLLTEQGGTDVLDETQGGEIGKRWMEDRQGGRERQIQGTGAPERTALNSRRGPW